MSAAAAAIVDRFYGVDYEDESDEGDHGQRQLHGGGGGGGGGEDPPTFSSGAPAGPGSDPGPQQQQEQHTTSMGRGKHLARPSWMENT